MPDVQRKELCRRNWNGVSYKEYLEKAQKLPNTVNGKEQTENRHINKACLHQNVQVLREPGMTRAALSGTSQTGPGIAKFFLIFTFLKM